MKIKLLASVLAVASLAAFGFMSVACCTSMEAIEEEQEREEEAILDNVVILEEEWGVTTYGTSRTITGTVRNDNDEEISLLTISVDFKDENGVVICSSSDYINDMKPGQTYEYEVVCFELDGIPTDYDMELSATTY